MSRAESMGFNGAQAPEGRPRFLYWADVLGLLVWEEMPSASIHSKAVERIIREWTE